ncbi:MAG TPA: sigma-70 family RNA polymerase sigma factor [Marmoricola sp.]|nr:sigma-70 family RNA polymerase sigma factor [Marmoricola sp.]
MTELLEGTRAPSDPELISGVRSGDLDAYGELFSRHADAALRLARQLTRGSDAEDLVSEAFTKVMGILTEGGGPDVAFRAYLLIAIRRLYVDRVRRDSRLTNSGDMTTFDPGVPFQDTVVAEFESSAAARAFATLPERWQLVLWHLEVENQKPADIARLLGMSPNSVSALAYRAREGLRQAFLSAHLADTSDADCRWTVEHLGGYVREGLAKRDSIKVKGHLDACRSCTAMHLELTEVNSDLRGIIAPLLLGTAAAGYLAGAGSGAGVSAFMVLLGRARDALFGASGTSAGATTGATTAATTTATAGTSAGAVGGTAAGTMAGSTAAAVGATAAGTTVGTAAATTAAATTVAGVTTGGAVAGVAAGTTAGVVVGAAVAGAAPGVTAGVGAAGLAMIAVGSAALTLGIGGTHQAVGSGLPTTFPGATTSASPDPSSVPSSAAPVPEQVDPTPPPSSPTSLAVAVTMPSTSAESEPTTPSGEADEVSGQAGEPSDSPTLPGIDTAPDGVVTQESDPDEDPTDEPSATPAPDPSPTPSDSPDDVATPSSDPVSTPPDGSSSSPVVPTPSSSPALPTPTPTPTPSSSSPSSPTPPSPSPGVSATLGAQPLDPSDGQTP